MTLFRCSKLGDIMTPPRAKKDVLSKTCTDYLDELYINGVYGREKDISNKYVEKGLSVEEDSITLFTSVTGTFLVKNEEQYQNEYIKGTPDIVRDDVIIDIKSSWDIWTFSKAALVKNYYWQLMGYMWLTGRKKAVLAYCLVNAPEDLIQDELRRLSWRMMMIDTENPLFLEAEEKIRKNLEFDDISEEERVKVFEMEYDEGEIERLKTQIDLCRDYLKNKNKL